jgi:2-isopropylmalate synthase
MSKIKLFDTTLRDGEQSPGVSLSIEEKLEIARQLAKLNIDVIEAGFPVISPGDFASVRAIAENISGPVICGLARANRVDIEKAWEAIKPAEKRRIHTFIATSDIHMKYKLQMEPAKVIEQAVAAVKLASGFTKDVEFSAEDATRSNWEFLSRIVSEVIAAGATTVNIPDTVGYTTPREFAALIRYLRENVRDIDRITLSVHCHNDLGLAVANSLAAIQEGVTQIEGTINGIGERAGNTALEEIIMALNTRKDYYQITTEAVNQRLYRVSRLVSTLTGMPVQPNKAIVGSNAFAHESGIHQDGMLKNPTTYEIMRPEDIGLKQSKLVMGKHSGRHALTERLQELGYQLSPEELDKVFSRFKTLADQKKEITDQDLEALLRDEMFSVPEHCRLVSFHIVSGNQTTPTATVKLEKDGVLLEEAATGDGPVDAIYKAIDRIIGVNNKLIEYSLQGVSGGTDALGEVTVKIQNGSGPFLGRGLSTDILAASANAYVNAVNKLIHQQKNETQKGE